MANEIANKRHFVFGSKLKAMGKLNGVADFIFMSPLESVALELKSATGKLRPHQIAFKNWCDTCKVLYEVSNTLEHAQDFIRQRKFYTR